MDGVSDDGINLLVVHYSIDIVSGFGECHLTHDAVEVLREGGKELASYPGHAHQRKEGLLS